MENVSLWNTPVNEMTVGDALKLNGTVLAAMASVVVVAVGVGVVSEKIGNWRNRRSNRISVDPAIA